MESFPPAKPFFQSAYSKPGIPPSSLSCINPGVASFNLEKNQRKDGEKKAVEGREPIPGIVDNGANHPGPAHSPTEIVPEEVLVGKNHIATKTGKRNINMVFSSVLLVGLVGQVFVVGVTSQGCVWRCLVEGFTYWATTCG